MGIKEFFNNIKRRIRKNLRNNIKLAVRELRKYKIIEKSFIKFNDGRTINIDILEPNPVLDMLGGGCYVKFIKTVYISNIDDAELMDAMLFHEIGHAYYGHGMKYRLSYKNINTSEIMADRYVYDINKELAKKLSEYVLNKLLVNDTKLNVFINKIIYRKRIEQLKEFLE